MEPITARIFRSLRRLNGKPLGLSPEARRYLRETLDYYVDAGDVTCREIEKLKAQLADEMERRLAAERALRPVEPFAV
jgi:hypothetical protein